MQKRHISNNIRLVLDMMDYSDYINSDGFIFFLEYYLAFDTLEHAFLFHALEKIGFGDSFYLKTNLCIMIIGLVMVWCSSCLTIKVFCSGIQNFFRNTKYL